MSDLLQRIAQRTRRRRLQRSVKVAIGVGVAAVVCFLAWVVLASPWLTVSTVEVDQPPYSGTSVGGCVAAKFRGARVPAFAGSPVSVGKSFSIN